MLSPASISTRNELRYYKQRGKMPRLRIRVIPKSVKKPKTMVNFRITYTLPMHMYRLGNLYLQTTA